jgi:transcriptional regulator with XRE-family HTH domain
MAPHLAERDRPPNTRLALERRRRGWTQAQLAASIEDSIREENPGWAGLPTKQYISRWEQGVHPEPLYFRHLLKVFCLSPEALGLLPEQPHADVNGDSLGDMDLEQPVSRRTVLGGFLGLGAWAAFPGTGTARDTRAVQAYGQLVLEDEKLYWTATPGVLAPAVHERVRTGLYMLEQYDTPELASSVGRSALLAGRLLYFDLGWHAKAAEYWKNALELAARAHDTRLATLIYGHLAFGPDFAGDGEAWKTACLHAREGSGPSTRSWLHCVAAEIHARAGDKERALRQIRLAEDNLVSTSGHDPDWMDFFDARRLDGFTGQVDLLTGRNEEATGVLARVVPAAIDTRQRAVSLLDLAAAWGPLDPVQAVEHAGSALDVLASTPYPPALDRLPGVRGALPTAAARSQLEERIVAAGLMEEDHESDY